MRFLIVLNLLTIMLYSQDRTCCSTAPEKFVNFSSDKEFAPMHIEPIAFHFASSIGKMIEIKVEDDKPANAFEIKGSGSKTIFVIHEWWGLNDYIKKEAETIYNELNGEVNVIAIDLYDGKVADTREKAREYMQQATKNMNRIFAIFNASLKYAKESGDGDIATIGWCFGGGMSMQLAIEAGEMAEACIIYYGMPEENKERLSKLEADVLGIFATEDGWISPKVVSEFEKRMKKVDRSLEVINYEAGHAFANPSNSGHKPKMAQDAFENSIQFLKDKLNL